MVIQVNQNSSMTHNRTRDTFAASILPLDLWSRILSFLCQDPRQYDTVAACMLVNQDFLQLCIKQASSPKILDAFDCLPPDAPPKPHVIPLSLQLTCDYQICLAVGEEGTRYYTCKQPINRHILYLLGRKTRPFRGGM
jgi:hypothetical protein